MYLPISILEKVGNIPNRTVDVHTVLGYLLSFKKDVTKLSQLEINSLYKKLTKFPSGMLSNFQMVFENDYISPLFEKYSIEFPQITFDNIPKDLKDFNKLYEGILNIKELDMTRYFDSLFPNEEEGVIHLSKKSEESTEAEEDLEKLKYTLSKKDVFSEEFEVNSQNNSIARLNKLNYLTSGTLKNNLIVFNITNYILNVRGGITDEVLNMDIAEANALGGSLGKANKLVSEYIFKNFDELSENFF